MNPSHHQGSCYCLHFLVNYGFELLKALLFSLLFYHQFQDIGLYQYSLEETNHSQNNYSINYKYRTLIYLSPKCVLLFLCFWRKEQDKVTSYTNCVMLYYKILILNLLKSLMLTVLQKNLCFKNRKCSFIFCKYTFLLHYSLLYLSQYNRFYFNCYL